MLSVRDYPTPDEEAARFAEVKRFTVAGAALKNTLDAMTLLCTHLFDAKMSLISFIEDDAQAVQGATGLDVKNIARQDSLCAHAILSSEITVITDALDDPRFSKNRYVTAEPHIRFYAGMPIKSSTGFNIGTLCIADPIARPNFSMPSRGQMMHLTRAVSSRLDEMMSGSGGRAESRRPVHLQGMVSSYGKRPQKISISNISSRGAMIYSPDSLLPRGEEVVVSIGTTALVATVMWAKDGMNGLSFHRAIDADGLALMHKGRSKSSEALSREGSTFTRAAGR